MSAITFDTLDAARTLRAAGVEEKTAEAIVAVVQRTAELPDVSDLATKADVRATKVELEGLSKRVDLLQMIVLAGIGFNFAGFAAVAAFLYTVLKH